jgi:hypothetical protein
MAKSAIAITTTQETLFHDTFSCMITRLSCGRVMSDAINTKGLGAELTGHNLLAPTKEVLI